jgi:hypothetical protein
MDKKEREALKRLQDKLRNFKPSPPKEGDKCPFCGEPLGIIDIMRSRCHCQILTADDLNKRMTI